MRKYPVYAVGHDAHWLRAVAGLSDDQVTVEAILCTEEMSLDRLPPADPAALLLLDATGLSDVAGTVRRLWERGWRQVAVVAADPSWREAHAVFLAVPEYDYWGKSYDPGAIRNAVREYLRSRQQGLSRDAMVPAVP